MQHGMQVTRTPWGQDPQGLDVERIDVRSATGAGFAVTTFGATLLGVWTPDRNGEVDSVLLGYDTLEDYVRDDAYLGCVVGRCANRIAGSAFELDGVRYDLPANEGRHHLHGGPSGFHRKIWAAEVHEDSRGTHVRMTTLSPDGDGGYPGNLTATVTLTWTPDGSLDLSYEATTDQPTLCNLTHHGYWNLAGGGLRNLDTQHVQVHADTYMPIDAERIPLGAPRAVDNTPFDLRTPTPVGHVMRDPNPEIRAERGLDHDFVVQAGVQDEPQPILMLADPLSGRRLDLTSTEPGVQLFGGQAFSGTRRRSGGAALMQGDGLAIEPQRHPDAIHSADAATVILRPGERYLHRSRFSFSVAS
jgi:aldose 1-epimerase